MGLLFAVLIYLFLHGFDYYDDANVIYALCSKPVRIALCAVVVGFFVLLYGFLGKLFAGKNQKTLWCIGVIATLLAVAIQMYFVFVVRSYYKWDTGFVIGGASSLAETGRVTDEAYYYLSVYPNQNTYVWITAMLVKIANLCRISVVNRPLVYNLCNVICIDVAMGLVFFIGRLLHTRHPLTEGDRLRGWLLLLCNPFLYVGASYYYTITISLPFAMGFLCLVMHWTRDAALEKLDRAMDEMANEKMNLSWRSKKTLDKLLVPGILAGLVAGVGYAIRATMIVFVVAFVIYVVYRCVWADKQQRKGLLVYAIILLLSFGVSAKAVCVMSARYVGIDTTDTAFPTMHWVMMSLTEPGGHNAEDEAFTASFATQDEKKTAVRARAKEKLATMGVGGYLHLCKTKLERTFGDGSNGYTTFLTDAYDTGVVYEIFFGQHKDLVVLWHQGYYLFMLLGILLAILTYIRRCVHGLLCAECDYEVNLLFLAVVLFGGILFYLVWEASEQYSVPFMMVELLLMREGLAQLPSNTLRCETKVIGDRDGGAYHLSEHRFYFAIAMVLVVVTAVLSVAKYSAFTKTQLDLSYTSANQIIANSSIMVENGEELAQTFSLKQPCNHIIFQWRNPSMEESDAVYEVKLTSAQEVVFEDVIDSTGMGYNGFFEKRFDYAQGECELHIKKIGGSDAHNLEFVVYDMYGYTPYPGGELSLISNDFATDQQKHLDASLLFTLTNDYQGTYTSASKYIFFMVGALLIFLFMGIWCKIEEAPIDALRERKGHE